MTNVKQNASDATTPPNERRESASPSQSSPSGDRGPSERRSAAKAPAILVTLIIVAIVGLSLWYLVQPQPVLIQGEADATRIDIAARVEGRVGKRLVSRGDNVEAGHLPYEIDNPELLAKLNEAEAALAVASADLAHIQAGTRVEEIERHKSAVEAAAAELTFAQRTYDRIKELAGSGHAPLQRLDEVTNSLRVAQRSADQATFAYQEVVAGATVEERGIARPNVAKAQASVDTIQAEVNELIVNAPVAAQVYQIGAELGEYVSPGVPLLSLVELSDVWSRFDLRENLIKRLKVGEQFQMRVPALENRIITAEIKLIAAEGEYAGCA